MAAMATGGGDSILLHQEAKENNHKKKWKKGIQMAFSLMIWCVGGEGKN